MCRKYVRFGIIGTGVAAETHARELRSIPNARPVSVLARNDQKARAFSRTFSIPRAYSDLQAFLHDEDMDAVIIATPNGHHCDYAVAAAQAGKHLVIEKPLEINTERASRIVQAAARNNVGLFVIYQRRFSAAAQQAITDIRAGKIGKVILVNIVDNQYRKPEYYAHSPWRGTTRGEGGGCVMTQSTHLLDLAQYIVGPVRSVSAHMRTCYHDIETEDVAVATLVFRCGALGTFSSSTAAFPGHRHLLTVCGTKGSIMFNGEHDQIVFRCVEEGTFTELPAGFSFRDPSEPRDYPTSGQRRQLESIVKALLHGKWANDADGLLATVCLLDALYTSARQDTAVDVPLHGKDKRTSPCTADFLRVPSPKRPPSGTS